MLKKKYPREMADMDSQQTDSLYEDSANADAKNLKKRKPLFERLGLIEQVKDEKDGSVLLSGHEIGVSAESHHAEISDDAADASEKADKNQVDKLTVEEIYKKYGLEIGDYNTIYMIENFLKALPINLPNDIKRQSIINLIGASHLSVSGIISDGTKRADVLNKYYNYFSYTIDDIVAANEKHIKKLTERIAYHKKIIDDKIALKEEQRADIEFEIQKLMNLVEFIDNK